ncbi:MAG: LysR family transcriptional regulator [Caulobacterales bacterium]|nr:LysR family transcriptional regulator [Caulobacterales bacterium]
MIESCPSVRYLKVFEAVARLESVTRAAAEVGLTQPAVTQAIAKLELEIEEQLFDRRTTGTYLTDFGRELVVRVRRFFETLERTLVEMGLPNEKPALASRINRITRSQMRCHLAIARGQSFTHAATLIGVSQASLHRAARDLERNMGVALYRHTASGVVVTEAGERLATGLLAANHEIQQALEEFRTARGQAAGRIAVGTPMLDPAPFVAAVLDEFTRLYPDTSVQVVNRTFDELRRSLRSGTLDFMVGVLKEQEADFCDEPLFTDSYVIAVRANHPLANRASVSAEDLLDFDWIIPNQGAPRRHAFDNLFAKLDRKPKASIESHSLATIRATLYESDRLAILTRMEIAADEKHGLLHALPISNLDPSPVIGVTTRRDWLPTPRQQAFLDLLRSAGKGQTARTNSAARKAAAIV